MYKKNANDSTPTEYGEYFRMIERDQINLFLFPLPPFPQLVNNGHFLIPSRVIADNAMLSILSAKFQLNSIFHWFAAFDFNTWTAFTALYLIVAAISTTILKDFRVFFDYLGVAFNQGLKLNRNHKTSIITILWIGGSLITMWAYSGLLLSLIMSAPPIDRIDSLKDLVKRGCKFGVWAGETAQEIVTDPSGEYYHQLKDRVLDLRNSTVRKLNRELMLNVMGNGSYALVTDRLFNNYQFAKRIDEIPNLYLSKLNSNILPVFLALKKNNQDGINSNFNQM